MNNETDLELIKKDPAVTRDRLRFTKNSLPASLTYLAIVCNVVYFVILYHVNKTYFYTPMIGLSVIVNLGFMLTCFLCSEGIKNYKKKFGIVMFVVAAVQIARIFVLPMGAFNSQIEVGGQLEWVINEPEYLSMIAFLVASAASLIAGGVIGIIRSIKLEKTIAELNNKAE